MVEIGGSTKLYFNFKVISILDFFFPFELRQTVVVDVLCQEMKFGPNLKDAGEMVSCV